MPKTKRLTDVDLSKILSQQAAGKLTHHHYRIGDYGCVAGVVYDVEDQTLPVREDRPLVAIDMSNKIGDALGNSWNYPQEPEPMLELLARAGL